MSTEEVKKEEVPEVVEHEQDAKFDKKRKPMSITCAMNAYDTTLNCLVDSEGSIISTVSSDGMNALIAQARGNIGLKKGRYYFEVQALEAYNKLEFCIGVSTASAKWVGGENSIGFDQFHQLRSQGETSGKKAVKSITKHDVVGILLNLDSKATNKFTISLFVNGLRASEPIAIPEKMQKEALFPHIAFRSCSLGVNFKSIVKPLPFVVLPWQQASNTEVEKSKIERVDAPKACYPIALGETEASIAAFLAKNKGEHYLEISRGFFDEWVKQSGIPKKNELSYGVLALDSPQLLAPWLRSRPRNVVWALGNPLFLEERTKTLSYLPNFEKTAVVCNIKTEADRVSAKYAQAALPTMEEHLHHIVYEIPAEQAEKELTEWKNDQRLRSKVEDLKVGKFFSERNSGWTKFVTEKKATEEGKAFTDEDWMLANIRQELVSVVHAFKEDVEDETRPSFPPTLTTHYYKEYTKKQLNPLQFQCPSIEELIKEHLYDSLTIDENGLLGVKLDKEVDYQAIFDLVDQEREARETRVGAGDELSALKFSAKQAQHYVNKGGKGFAKGGNKRPGVPIPHGAQRMRVQ